MKKLERGGFEVQLNSPDDPAPLTESDDMRRVYFACHPDAPAKVLDEWDGPAHCPLCGSTAEPSS